MSQRESFLPQLRSSSRVDAASAMIDRFELQIGSWMLNGTASDIAAGLSNLSAYQVETADGHEVNWFQEENFRESNRRFYLNFRRTGQGPSIVALRPTLGGQLIAEQLNAPGRGNNLPGRYALRLNGIWNLTRFLQAHEFRPRSRLDRPQLLSACPLAIMPREDWWREERPLIPADNVVIGRPPRYALALQYPIEEHLMRYVRGTVDALSDAIIGQNFDTVEDRSLSEFRAGDIEFYWEFDHQNPINFVNTLSHYLPRVARRMRVTRRNLDQTETERLHQSQSVTVTLTRNRRLRVYSKTNRRVRFEVTFPNGYRSRSHPRITFSSVEEFLDAVTRLKTEAAETLNAVFDHLWVWSDENRFDPTPDQLRAEIVSAAPDIFTATTIIENLARNGRIALAPDDPLRETVHRLSRSSRAVLRSLPINRNIFVVERRYEYARRNLHLV